MKNISKISLGLMIALSVALIGGQSALAFGGGGDSDCQGGRNGGGGGKMMNGDRFHLVPDEMRDMFKTDWQNLSEEERAELKEERQATREQKRADMEVFVGLSREEIREAHQNGQTMGEILANQGVSEAEATDFLIEKANDKVDMIVERHDLSDTDEQTLRGRISEWVQNVLDRWFNN